MKLSEVVVWEEMVGPNFQRLWCGGDGWTKLSEVVVWEEMVGPNFQGCGRGGDG